MEEKTNKVDNHNETQSNLNETDKEKQSINKSDLYGQKIPVDKQSIELSPGLRTSTFCPDGTDLVKQFYPEIKTAYDNFRRGLSISGSKNCLGTRTGPNKEYEWITYDETFARAQYVGSGLLSCGLEAGQSTNVGIYANNCIEWTITGMALYMYNMVNVPLYDTLGPDACTFIINQAEISLVVCDTSAKAKELLRRKNDTPTLSTIVLINDKDDEIVTQATEAVVNLIAFNKIMEDGKVNMIPILPPKPDDLYTICYTSGTTGNPKGVMLTHANLVAEMNAVKLNLQEHMFTSSDVHISYLPLPHIFERMMQEFMFMEGASIGFFSRDTKQLLDDMQALKPTVFPLVPRVLNRLQDKIVNGVNERMIKRVLFKFVLRQKIELLNRGILTTTSMWDKLVFGKIQALLGGKVRIAIIGAAPVSTETLTFGRAAFGCYFFEAYGQTECTGGMTLTVKDETEAGHVGAPLACNLVKLVDVPDMGYYVNDGRGEVCCKGPNVMKGYYKEPERTAEAIDEEGWLHTGDVGQWMPNGTLKIIDRKKHIFKLAQGEYVAPEQIEAIYNRSPLVAQSFVDANSLETYVVAIIVPDEEVLGSWKAKEGLQNASFADLCTNAKLKEDILNSITALGKERGLKGFEQVKDIHLHPELFSPQNELLTPTMKSRRPKLRSLFAQHINDMYQKGKE